MRCAPLIPLLIRTSRRRSLNTRLLSRNNFRRRAGALNSRRRFPLMLVRVSPSVERYTDANGMHLSVTQLQLARCSDGRLARRNVPTDV